MSTPAQKTTTSLSRSFAKQMFQGKCGSAFQLLSGEQEPTGILGEEDVLPHR